MARFGNVSPVPTTSAKKTTKPVQPRSRRPVATPEEAKALYQQCTRFLSGTGRRDAETLLATIANDVPIDTYGAGGVVEELEIEVARRLGKEAALFMITGTMAQQSVLRIHA